MAAPNARNDFLAAGLIYQGISSFAVPLRYVQHSKGPAPLSMFGFGGAGSVVDRFWRVCAAVASELTNAISNNLRLAITVKVCADEEAISTQS
jgi:hypothetical protein